MQVIDEEAGISIDANSELVAVQEESELIDLAWWRCQCLPGEKILVGKPQDLDGLSPDLFPLCFGWLLTVRICRCSCNEVLQVLHGRQVEGFLRSIFILYRYFMKSGSSIYAA